MELSEYRKQNPKCGYCIYNDFFILNYCKAKDYPVPVLLEKVIAKKCPLYKIRNEI